jgi:hypothetical protein
LATDRVRRSSAQEAAVIGQVGSEDRDANDRDSQSLIDEPLAMALAEWRLDLATFGRTGRKANDQLGNLWAHGRPHHTRIGNL